MRKKKAAKKVWYRILGHISAQNNSEDASISIGYECSLFAVEVTRFEIFKSDITTFINIKQQKVYLCWVDHVSRMEDFRLQFCEIRTLTDSH